MIDVLTGHVAEHADQKDWNPDECKSFSFVAHWLNGERPVSTERVSAAALAKLIRDNKVGNNVRYVVG